MAAQVSSPSSHPLAQTTQAQDAPLLFDAVPYTPQVPLSAPYPPSTTFPLALTPSNPAAPISEKVSAIRTLTQNNTLSSLLHAHSAIYFKDLNLTSAEEFSAFASAFGWIPHEDIGNPVRRTIHAYNVATANEGPNTQPVYPHNEFGLSPHFPKWVLFYCASAPETGMHRPYPISSLFFVLCSVSGRDIETENELGGETPINNSVILYERLLQKHPKFIAALDEKGVKYQLFYPNTAKDQTSSPGTSVRQSYGKNVLDSDTVEEARAKIENEIRRLPTATWVWENQSADNELGDLRVWQVLPGTPPPGISFLSPPEGCNEDHADGI
jgi:hypothetical protein